MKNYIVAYDRGLSTKATKAVRRSILLLPFTELFQFSTWNAFMFHFGGVARGEDKVKSMRKLDHRCWCCFFVDNCIFLLTFHVLVSQLPSWLANKWTRYSAKMHPFVRLRTFYLAISRAPHFYLNSVIFHFILNLFIYLFSSPLSTRCRMTWLQLFVILFLRNTNKTITK